MHTSLLLLLAPILVTSFTITTPSPSTQSSHLQSLSDGSNEIDVSDLGLTLEDLNKPLPKELLSDTLTLSGYQTTSRLPDVDDKGCYWVENSDDLDVTLQSPGLRGQPAACISVLFSTTTISVAAFGRVVWSAIQMGYSDPDDCSFITEDGEGMVPVIQIHMKKRDAGERWGGFILQVGEDSIL
jgi:hypothetical protein